MPEDRFLITFQTNITNALRALDQLAAKVAEVEAKINATAARAAAGINLGAGSGAAAIPPGVSQNVAQATARLQQVAAASTAARASFAGLSPQAGVLGGSFANLGAKAQILQQVVASLPAGSAAQAAAIRAAIPVWQQWGAAQAQAGQSAQGVVTQLGRWRQQLAPGSAALGQFRGQLNQTSDSFAAHAKRISETILVYSLFFGAIAGARALGDLAINLDRESRRFEAVTGILGEETPKIIAGLGEIAVATVTPIEELTAAFDQMASATLNLPPGIERANAALEIANVVGKVTTVTQRSVASETENVIAIMKQFGFTTDQLGDALGKITVAGGNSSTVISGLTDALQVSAQAAKEANTSFDILLAVESEFLIRTGRTGTSVGNTFKTLFARFTDPDVANSVAEITNGIVKLRDTTGSIRDPIRVMLELNEALRTGRIDATQFSDAFEALTPPLNPGAKNDLILINRLLEDISPRVAEISRAGEESLDSLVAKINDALGPRFHQLLEKVKAGFANLFLPEFISTGKGILSVLDSIVDTVGKLPPELIVGTAQFLLFLGAFKTAGFVIGNVLKLLGIGGLLGTVRLITPALYAAGGATAVLQGALFGLEVVLRRILPIAIAFAAVDLATNAITQADKINALKDQLGIDSGLAEFLVHSDSEPVLGGADAFNELQRQFERRASEANGVDFAQELADKFGFGASRAGEISPNQLENVNNLAQAIHDLNQQGELTPERMAKMVVALKAANNEFGASTISVSDLVSAAYGLNEVSDDTQSEIDKILAEIRSQQEEQDKLTQADLIAAEAERLRIGLTDDLSSALKGLTDQYASGKISLDEYTQGQDDASRAADQAAGLVAAVGDQLAKIPELAGPAAKGTDELTSALFDLILQSGNTQSIDILVQKIIQLAASVGFTSEYLKAHPFIVYTGAVSLPPGVESAVGGFPEGQPGTSNTVHNNRSRTFEDINAQIQQLIRGLFQGITTGSSGANPSGPSSTRSNPQVPVVDIGDLKPRQVAQIISIATALRNKIPGETERSKDSIATLIKDGEFLRNIRGIDDRLLRIAIQQLTDEMETANDLASEQLKKDALLRNLTVRTGPLGALISQPSTFGLAGSVAQGTGLNFDPSQGNFVINVPVELKGLEPAKLQQLIYNIISQAIRDAARL